MDTAQQAVLTIDGLQILLDALRQRGYRVVGPTVRDQAIVYDDIASIDRPAAGWTDEQDGGHYRLKRRDDDALFGYAVGPHAWKRSCTRRCCACGARSMTGTGVRVSRRARTR